MKNRFLITLIFLLFIQVATFADNIANEARLEYNKGIDYYKIGQYEKAAEYFRSAINISPDFIDAYYNLGSILDFLKQYDGALVVFEQIAIRKPDDYEALLKAAQIAQKLGKNELSLKYADLIPAKASQYSSAQTLISKLKSNGTTYQVNVPLQTIDTSKYPQNSFLFEGIQGPTGMVTDDLGNLYVACYSDNTITKIYPDGKRIIFSRDKKINGPIGLAIDVGGNIYVANYLSNNILKISKNSEVKILIGNINKPYGLYLKGNMLYISSQGSNSVLRYKLQN